MIRARRMSCSPNDEVGSVHFDPTHPPLGTSKRAPYAGAVTDQRRGLLLGVTAYVLWGGFPLYWPHLEPAGALEILAHRVLWSLVTMGLLVLVLRRRAQFRALFSHRRTFLLLPRRRSQSPSTGRRTSGA